MLEKIFSKKILDAQIVKISDDTENVFEIANQVIEFENNYPNKKKLPIYIKFNDTHAILVNPIQFNVLLRLLMDANVFFKFYFESEPKTLQFAYLQKNFYEVEKHNQEEKDTNLKNFQVVKLGEKPKNKAELEFDEI